MFLGLYTYLNPLRFTICSTDGVSGVKKFKYAWSGFLCCVCGLISLEFMPLFMVFNLLIGPGFLSLVINFYFFNSHLPVTSLGLDLFLGAYLNKLLFL
jgi:hypothetical protein